GPMSRFRTFLTESRGGLAVIFALALLPIMAAAGVSVDYARAASARQALQARLDAAVLAGVREEQDSARRTTAEALFDNYPLNDGTQANIVSRSFTPDGKELAGDAVATLETGILGILRIHEITVRAQSRAMASGASVCILVNNPTASQ